MGERAGLKSMSFLGYAALLVGTVRLLYTLIGYYIVGTSARHHLESAWFLFAVLSLIALAILRERGGHQSRSAPRRTLIPYALPFVGASCALYVSVLGIGLLSDDYVLLSVSPLSNEQWEFFRPLPLFVWFAVYPIAGEVGLHLLNIVLHGVNAWLLFRLMLDVVPRSSVAACGACSALFLAFPAAVEAVAWNAAVFDVSMTTATLVYLHALLRSGWGSRATAVGAAIAALLCKETGVAIPLMGLTLAAIRRVDIASVAASAGIALAYTAFRLLEADPPLGHAPLGYFVKEMIARPFAALGTPWTRDEVLSAPVLYAVLPQGAIALIIGSYLTGGGASIRSIVTLAWVLIATAPLGSYLYINDNLENSRYLYLALVGWCMFLNEILSGQKQAFARRATFAVISGAVVMAAMGAWRHQRNWQLAAETRDEVLSSVEVVAKDSACERVVLLEIPDSVSGAYVFRNGLQEALRERGSNVVVTSPNTESFPAGCRFVWDGDAFAPAARQP